jgi:hypothetical protein
MFVLLPAMSPAAIITAPQGRVALPVREARLQESRGKRRGIILDPQSTIRDLQSLFILRVHSCPFAVKILREEHDKSVVPP